MRAILYLSARDKIWAQADAHAQAQVEKATDSMMAEQTCFPYQSNHCSGSSNTGRSEAARHQVLPRWIKHLYGGWLMFL